MERRTALKNLLIVAGGVMVLPSCLHQPTEASIPLRHLKITAADEKLLSEFAGTLIPTTHTPGARDTYAHLFVLKMMDDCFEEEVQGRFIRGISELEALSKKSFGQSFVKCNTQQREQLLADLEQRLKDRKEPADNLTTFYDAMKRLTIRGYLNSQYVLTNVLKYELVPGRYNGFAPAKQTIHNV